MALSITDVSHEDVLVTGTLVVIARIDDEYHAFFPGQTLGGVYLRSMRAPQVIIDKVVTIANTLAARHGVASVDRMLRTESFGELMERNAHVA